jgi:hypothetical protein
MKRTALNLIFSLAAMAAPAAFGMHYTVNTNPNLGPTIKLPPLVTLENNASTCTAASNTIAVGFDADSAGYRILCADAGRIGFWTTPVPGDLVGHLTASSARFLCPSGSALAGLQFIEGLVFPFPLCGELVPDFQTGLVSRKVLFTVDNTVVEKLSKTAPVNPGDFNCGPAGWVESLIVNRNASGAVAGFGGTCNTIETAPANIEDVNVDLAVRTFGQAFRTSLSGNSIFRVDVFNLGNETIPLSIVTVDVRFDGLVWQLQPFGNASCTDILAHKGPVDRIVVGKHCTIAGVSLAGKGGVASTNFELTPSNPATPPGVPIPYPVVSVTVSLNSDSFGADPNSSNDLAAFPVLVQ